MQRRRDDDRHFNLGRVLSAPFADREWLSKCVPVGLLSLVPIFGVLHTIGWSRAVTVRRIDGDETLPTAGIEHIAGGWRALLSFLPAVLVGSAVPTLLGAAFGALLDLVGGGGGSESMMVCGLMGAWFGVATVGVGSLFLKPASDYLHVVEGEPAAGLALRQQLELIRTGGVANYALFALIAFLSVMVAPFGFVLLVLGGVLTVPLTEAWRGAAIAEFERVVRSKTADNAIEGTVGAASGSPFGVSL